MRYRLESYTQQLAKLSAPHYVRQCHKNLPQGAMQESGRVASPSHQYRSAQFLALTHSLLDNYLSCFPPKEKVKGSLNLVNSKTVSNNLIKIAPIYPE